MGRVARRIWNWVRTISAAGAVATVGFSQSALTPTWTYTSGSEGWLPRQVSLGNRGTQVFAKLGVFQAPARLLSTTADEPVAPVWQNTDPAATYNRFVAASPEADVYVSAHDVLVPGSTTNRNVFVQCYTSTSSAPMWTYTFPTTTNGHDNFNVFVSRDGQRIYALFQNIYTSSTEIKVFQPSSSTPIGQYSINLMGPFRHFDFSADGQKLLIGSQMKVAVIELATGNVLSNLLVFDTMYDGFAISGDGSTYAYGLYGGYRVFRRNSSGVYEQRFLRSDPNWVCNRIDISADGSTLVAASDDAPTLHSIKLETLDLAPSLTQGQAVVRATTFVTATGQYTNTVQDLAISRDGHTLAVGVAGDAGGPTPELLVYRDFATQPDRTLQLPGSVFDLELSPDGRHMVVGSKLQHHNTFSGGGRIDMLELGSGDLLLHGTPRLGSTVQLEIEAPAAEMTFVLSSNALAEIPTVFPQMGSLYLPRSNMTITPGGMADATGVAHVDITIPNDASLVGRDVFYQAFRANPRRLTQDWVQMTILP